MWHWLDRLAPLRHGVDVGRWSAVMCMALLVVPASALAAETVCPTTPSGFSSFASVLSGLVDRFVGSPRAGTVSPLAELNDEQEKDVLDELAKELAGKRAELADEREAEAAEERLQNLRQRIVSRDRLEQDPRLARLRGQDAMGQVSSPRLRDPKPLSEIIEQETERDNPSLGRKYAKAYGEAIRRAIEADPKSFAETAGTIAGGDYKAALPKVMEWGASGFATVVTDALDEMGYESTKEIWGVAVGEAATAKEVMLALARGDHDSAWNTLKERAKEEVKSQSRSAAKRVINWATDIAGDEPSILGKTPGELYLDLLDAEVTMIEWSQKYLREKFEAGDGACIRRYEEAYAQVGQEEAYDKFDECIVTARYSAFPEFGNQARGIGLDGTAALKAFLEAHRKRESNAWTPAEWIAEKIGQREAEIEKTMLPELSRAENVMAGLAEAAGRAVSNRLTELAAAKLNERQWDQLESKVRELEQLLDATLASVRTDLDRIRKNSDAVAEACKAYDTHKKVALDALNASRQVSIESDRLLGSIRSIDASVCRAAEAARPDGSDDQRRRDAVKGLGSESELLEAEVLQVCRTVDSVKGSATRPEAKVHLDRGLATARDAEARAARLKVDADELARLGREPSSGGDDEKKAERRRDVVAALAKSKGEIEALAGRYFELLEKFRASHESMASARRRIVGLAPVTKDMVERTKACIAPLADAPIAEEPRRLMNELAERSINDQGCLGVINESWLVRDPDPGLGGNLPSTAPWEGRQLTLLVSIDRLRAAVAETEALCMTEVKPQDAVAPASDMDGVAAMTSERAGKAAARIDECVAAALVAYANISKSTGGAGEAPVAPQGPAEDSGRVRPAPSADETRPTPMEPGMNRPGSDYGHILLDQPEPALCQRACQTDDRCRAWTYVKPGIQGPKAFCWLKNPAPAPVPDPVAVSGIKPDESAGASTLPPMEQGTDRMGSDYRNFNLAEAQPLLCQRACHAESGCRAWTYVKPGVQGPSARCWLKNSVPPAKPSACCVSGVKSGSAGQVPAAGQGAAPANAARQYFVYYKSDEFTCCKNEKGEVPHPLLVGEVKEWTPTHQRLAGPFSSAEQAKQWACNHEIYKAQAWISNWARVGGVLVSNLPCQANR